MTDSCRVVIGVSGPYVLLSIMPVIHMLHGHVKYVQVCKKWEDYNGDILMSWICTYKKLHVQKYFYLLNVFCVLDIAWDTCQN